MEGSESDPSCAPISATVWFHYTAAATGTITVDTEGSDFDTVIGAYTGSALGSLTAVGCDDDGGSGTLSSLEVTVQAGTTYRFQVGGYGGGPPRFGSLTFNLTSVASPSGPANDNFADAEILGPLPSTVTQSTVGATEEGSEPGPSYVQATVWFGYTAAATGLLIADTAGSDFETRVGVWTGTDLGNLTEVDTAEQYVGPDYDQVRVEFTGQAGVRYWFQLGGYYADTGNLIFALTAPGSISGTVVDAATDQPIASLIVRAVLGSTTQASASTDASGHYSLPGLTPGDYDVMFSGPGYLYLPQWWDGHASSAAADPVTVNWGTDTSGIDASLTLNDDPVAGTYWEIRDCDTSTLTSHFSATTDCFRLWTDRYLFWPYLSNPYAGMIVTAPGGDDDSFPCPITAPCTSRVTVYSSGTGTVSGYFWYWYISGEDRVPGAYTLQMCGGASQSLCDQNILLTTTFTITSTPVCAGLRATIIGTAQADLLLGTPGRDVIVGLGGNDTIYGLGGNDVICGGPGDDILRGDNGNDSLYGDAGNDTLSGGAGNDLITGGVGVDLVRFNTSPAAVVVNLVSGVATGFGTDTLSGVENVEGSRFGDTLTGNAGANTLLGGNGADILWGMGGRDVLTGGLGVDTLNGGGGIDTCSGEIKTACEL